MNKTELKLLIEEEKLSLFVDVLNEQNYKVNNAIKKLYEIQFTARDTKGPLKYNPIMNPGTKEKYKKSFNAFQIANFEKDLKIASTNVVEYGENLDKWKKNIVASINKELEKVLNLEQELEKILDRKELFNDNSKREYDRHMSLLDTYNNNLLKIKSILTADESADKTYVDPSKMPSNRPPPTPKDDTELYSDAEPSDSGRYMPKIKPGQFSNIKESLAKRNNLKLLKLQIG